MKKLISVSIIIILFCSVPFMTLGGGSTSSVRACGNTAMRAMLPFVGKVQYSQKFHNPNDMYSSGYHDGIDFASVGGEAIPIIANASGTVEVPAYDSDGFGNYVVLKTKDKNGEVLNFYFGHMKSVTVKSGDTVSPGIELGKMGTTGFSTGVHLHFEVRTENGEVRDGTSYVFDGNEPKQEEFIENTTPAAQPVNEKCTSSGGGVTNLSGNTNAEKTWNFFKEKGFTNEGIAGIIGNFMVESSLDPLIGESGGSGGGRGIAQWGQCGTASNGASAGCRWKELENWAKSSGLNPDELGTQLGFTYYEMEQRGMIDIFKTSKTLYVPGEGSYGGGTVGIFCEKFEAPAIQYAHMDKRHSFAMDAMAQFGGS